ncbi:MAG: cephalosporin hydroxylase [Clostridiales bacterium]|nr:cephalosporin hydroxylase [Clostridiales bacterium]
MSKDKELEKALDLFNDRLGIHKWVYNFSWLGRPIIQTPTDVFALQEMVWEVKPDLIIETGIAHGGSLILASSLLELLGGDRKVIGIDIDIRQHNRIEIERHPMYKRITMLEGSSTDKKIVEQVYNLAEDRQKILVLLDSCHTHEHVLAEMQSYSKLVSKDSYLVVYDTCVETLNDEFNLDRPWGKGNSPYTAVQEFLKTHDEFKIDLSYEKKYVITNAPSGRLRRIK